ncbi:type 1 glutamine amidotransferase [Ktedonosporobacter rubrisoli]|uniref:Type 1 glutamine amidotransferase n=1 Tax=Ktedonosporobacter rubrisoli TaxID=2509675 RepID=A0A4P6K1F9_KTERU|nr:type 1 glutamine amidotransferase [Ktedonosporobacter rubrisoli]QBD81673.1 type 1 glutamine amidotransferase [Ktedonosporobacter rubrisoli]
MAILILQHVEGDHPGLLGEMLQSYHLPYQVVKVDAEPLPDRLDYEALIVLGGPQSAADNQTPSILQEKALIGEALARDIPYLGLCLGGQLLAAVCGAEISQGTVTEIGFYEVQLTEEGLRDPLFCAFPDRSHQVFHWHHDTFELPAGAVLLERGATVASQSFRYGARAYGFQYHMELTAAMVPNWLDVHPEREQALRLLGEGYQRIRDGLPTRYPLYARHTALLFDNFLTICGLRTQDEHK